MLGRLTYGIAFILALEKNVVSTLQLTLEFIPATNLDDRFEWLAITTIQITTYRATLPTGAFKIVMVSRILVRASGLRC